MTSLRQRMIEDMQIRNLSVHTQTSLCSAGVAIRAALQQITGAVGT